MPSENWYKLPETAQLLGVSEVTLRRRIKDGRLPSKIHNGKYFLLVSCDPSSGRYFLKEDPQLSSPSPTLVANLSPAAPTQPNTRAEIERLKSAIKELEQKVKNLTRKNGDLETLVEYLEGRPDLERVSSEAPKMTQETAD